jgi:hypothetical protein
MLKLINVVLAMEIDINYVIIFWKAFFFCHFILVVHSDKYFFCYMVCTVLRIDNDVCPTCYV